MIILFLYKVSQHLGPLCGLKALAKLQLQVNEIHYNVVLKAQVPASPMPADSRVATWL